MYCPRFRDDGSRPDLPLVFGATPVDARVVVDRNRVTGGGVTVVLDFGQVLLARLLGDDIAKLSQLAMEHDPEPPFQVGMPKKAAPGITREAREWLGLLRRDGAGLRAVGRGTAEVRSGAGAAVIAAPGRAWYPRA